MKRIAATLTGLALALGLIAFAPAADAAVCEFSVPQMPDECLTQPVYEYVTGLQADDLWQRTSVSTLSTENYHLRTEMWQMGTDLTAAHQATSLALSERDAALDQLDRVNDVVTALRVKVKMLKKRIRKLEQLLPFSSV